MKKSKTQRYIDLRLQTKRFQSILCFCSRSYFRSSREEPQILAVQYKARPGEQRALRRHPGSVRPGLGTPAGRASLRESGRHRKCSRARRQVFRQLRPQQRQGHSPENRRH